MCTADLGFRTFKLVTSNTLTRQPDRKYLEGALLETINHFESDHPKEDMPCVLLLKLGSNICVRVGAQTITTGKSEQSDGSGTSIAAST